MTTWYTADTHFGHARIIEYCQRPFATVQEMDEGLVERWNERVADDDHVLVLGDFALGKIAESLQVVRRLKGHKVLVSGNHDRSWYGMDRKKATSHAWAARYLDSGFESVLAGHPVYDHHLPGYDGPVTLSHFPYVGDSHGEDRYVDFRPTHRKGHVLLHGHVHDAWPHQTRPGLQLNVGVDVNDYAPVPAAELVARIAALSA